MTSTREADRRSTLSTRAWAAAGQPAMAASSGDEKPRSPAAAQENASLVMNFFECPCAHLAAAHMACDQHTARRAVRVRQGEGRLLCVVAEQALAARKYDGINQKPKLVHQPGCEQLAHHIAATPGQQVGAVLAFERAYRVGEVALQRMTVLPTKRVGSVRDHVLRHAVEQVSDGVAG